MSRKHTLQDGTGVLDVIPGEGVLKIVQRVAPTDAQAGYVKGCVWINLSGAAGLIFYINKGSVTSTDWLAVT